MYVYTYTLYITVYYYKFYYPIQKLALPGHHWIGVEVNETGLGATKLAIPLTSLRCVAWSWNEIFTYIFIFRLYIYIIDYT